MSPEIRTRDWLRAIDERLDAHSGRLDELQTLAAQQAVMTRAIEAAIALGVESVSTSSRWIKITCWVVCGAAVVGLGLCFYLVAR